MNMEENKKNKLLSIGGETAVYMHDILTGR